MGKFQKKSNISISKFSSIEGLNNLNSNDYSRWSATRYFDSENFAYKRLNNHVLFEPYINPEFNFSKNDNVFTIGSCFARGLEKSLIQENINVLSVTKDFDNEYPVAPGSTALGFMNKYNTYSILNEFDWALNNKFTHGENFIKINDKTYFDTNTNPTLLLSDFNTTLERRLKLKSIFESVTKCKLITITLGLIETWYDKELKIYLNRKPPQQVLDILPSRFEIIITGFQENLNNLEKLYELFKNHLVKDFQVVITVSPVPLQATYSGKDIVIANTLSKSLLRTVADVWAYNHNNVHYFPSYEIVMNSDQNLVWEKDRRHVKGIVSQYVMEIFKRYYLEKYSDWKNKIPQLKELIFHEQI